METEKEYLYVIIGNNLSEVIYNEKADKIELRHIKFLNFNDNEMFKTFKAIDDEAAILLAEIGD